MKNLYFIVGLRDNKPLFADNFFGNNAEVSVNDPEVENMLRQYKGLAEGSKSINTIIIYYLDENLNCNQLVRFGYNVN